jgi:hypothetical protein
MRITESAPIAEPKAIEAHKRQEPERKPVHVGQHDTAASWLTSQPGGPPLSAIQAVRRSDFLSSPKALGPNVILQLQRRYGNQYVQKLLESPAKSSPLSNSESALSPIEYRAKAKSEFGTPYITPDVESRLTRSKGTGRPLPQPLRSPLEPSIGADFGSGNIHTGPEGAEMTTQTGVKTLTRGSGIYFNQGEYAPESSSGKHPPAHEMTHTVHQGASASRAEYSYPRVQASTGAPTLQRAWYNFSIPFTDYEFDPSLEGLKTAGNLAVEKAKEGATWVKDKVAAAAEFVFDKIKGLISAGIDWLATKFNEIKEFAVSSFADIKGALSGALGAVMNPLGAITNAIGAMDSGTLAAAWRALSAGAIAALQTAKDAINGVLKVGGGIWETISGYINTLFSAVDGLLNSTTFGLMPGFIQDAARGLYKTVKNLWASIQDFWSDFWKRLTSFVKSLLDSIQGFVRKVVSYAIDRVVETIQKIKQVRDFVDRLVTDPESAIRPIIAKIAEKIQAEAPGKAKEVAQQKMAQALASSQSSPGTVIHAQRSPGGFSDGRSTATRAEVDSGVNRTLKEQWAALDIPKMLWDTVVNTFWPPATIRAIGHEFSELWNTDWKNAAHSLFTPRSIFDDFGGFWHDVWSNFLVLLDFPLALWRRLNSVLTLLMGYVSIILILVGLVGGAIAGGVPGALAGAAAGAELAWALGEALFLSFLLAESSSALKSFVDLYTARQTQQEKAADFLQIAASTIGIGVAIVIALLFSLLGVLARDIVGRIKASRGAVEPPDVKPPETQPPETKPPEIKPPETDGCFVAGTPVWTPDGLRPIESLRAGDRVLACDPESGKHSVQPVVTQTVHIVSVILDIVVDAGTISCTPSHPFWSPGTGWMDAGDLCANTPVLLLSGDVAHIIEVQRRTGSYTVYNLSVDTQHTYFVSGDGVLVHNKPVPFRLTDRAIRLERSANEVLSHAEALPESEPNRPALVQQARGLQPEATDLATKGRAAANDAALEPDRAAIERLEERLTDLDEMIDTVREAPQLEAEADALHARAEQIPNTSPVKWDVIARIGNLQREIGELRQYIEHGLVDRSVSDEYWALRRRLADLEKEVSEQIPPPPTADPWQQRLDRAKWSDHGRKHMQARSAEQAKEMTTPTDRDPAPPSQYLPEVDNQALELEALRRGTVIRGDPTTPGSTVHVRYDAGRIIGYDGGEAVTTMRAEIAAGDVYHGHPRKF